MLSCSRRDETFFTKAIHSGSKVSGTYSGASSGAKGSLKSSIVKPGSFTIRMGSGHSDGIGRTKSDMMMRDFSIESNGSRGSQRENSGDFQDDSLSALADRALMEVEASIKSTSGGAAVAEGSKASRPAVSAAAAAAAAATTTAAAGGGSASTDEARSTTMAASVAAEVNAKLSRSGEERPELEWEDSLNWRPKKQQRASPGERGAARLRAHQAKSLALGPRKFGSGRSQVGSGRSQVGEGESRGERPRFLRGVSLSNEEMQLL